MRASASGTAQGSPRWSTVRLSARRIRRPQSSAPRRIHCDCATLRSADSTCTARHCCQTMDEAMVTTMVTMTIAASRAAPRWCVRG